ncbi:hypothetical protein ABPG74_012703 [Tetrahymena malaccensis]
MWYKYFSKQSWNLRIWRKANLKYNQDDFGMLQPKYVARFGDFRYRLVRTEGALRGCMFFVGFGCFSIINYLYGRYGYIINESSQKRAAQDLIDNDLAAEKVLFKNRVGAPTRPLRSLDDMMTFLSGSATYDQLADYASYNHAMDVNQDQQAGLDSWMSEKDKNMVKYYQRSLGKKVEGI